MFSYEDIWNHVISELARATSQTVLRAWFDGMKILRISEDTAFFYTPAKFKRDMILNRYADRIKVILSELLSVPMSVEIITEEELEDFTRQETLQEDKEDYKSYTFDRFVVGSSNKFAHAAAQAVSDNPAGAYNPLFIYGTSGLGKTHLLYAIMTRVMEKFPHFKVQYVTAETFTRQLVTAIRLGKNYEFHDNYRRLDMLLVDDIHFIAGKEFSQEEFFHTFNTLHEAGRQIILASDRPPKDVSRLEERLRTRFEWGLIADIQPPDYETRLAIVNVKAFRLGLSLPEEVSDYIAGTISSNIRQLEGVVKKMMAYRDLVNKPISMETAEQAISEIVRESPGLSPTPTLNLQEVCDFYNLDSAQVLGANRRSDVVRARQLTMYLCRLLTTKSLHDIGKFINRDHTTVGHGCEKVEALRVSDPMISKDIQSMIENIRNK
ncbi:MAG: chromosomal replication initiator protein DnaA [Oscillospiraceae bacterium]|nr:chromosomal replication initiator protein DnaA [Oscillospiraceae bacterium]